MIETFRYNISEDKISLPCLYKTITGKTSRPSYSKLSSIKWCMKHVKTASHGGKNVRRQFFYSGGKNVHRQFFYSGGKNDDVQFFPSSENFLFFLVIYTLTICG